jgi:ribosomal-protein-alanine N-acetyltransferase
MIDYSIFDSFPVLESERLLLRRFTLDDTDLMFNVYSDARANNFIGRDPVKTHQEIVDKIKLINDSFDNQDGISWAITLKPFDKYIGTVGLWKLFKEHHRAEIGYRLDYELWNKGIMSEAIQLVKDFGFNKMKLHSIEANTDKNNIASHKVLAKNGFVKEAHFKENWFYNGEFLDSVIYCIINPNDNK